MNFIMNRDFQLKGFGHTLNFVKGKEQYVPPVLRGEARRYGATTEDEAEDVVVDEQESEIKTPRDEPQGEERARILNEACDALVGRNSQKDFGANGAPKIQAILDLTGFRIDANERNDVWTAYNKAKHDALNPSNVSEEALDGATDNTGGTAE